jgi:hypothetical protein
MPVPIPTLIPTPCEWCSTGLFQRRMATWQIELASVGRATARLCDKCADAHDGPRTPLLPIADILDVPGMADVNRYLAAAQWTDARTVPEYPHAYLLLSRSADPVMHLRAGRWIRQFGARRPWAPGDGPAAGKRVWCSYHDAGEFTYWTQPSPADPILNRRAAA